MTLKKLLYAVVLSGTALGLAACGDGMSPTGGTNATQLLPDGGVAPGGGPGTGPVGGTSGGGTVGTGGGGAGGGGPMGW